MKKLIIFLTFFSSFAFAQVPDESATNLAKALVAMSQQVVKIKDNCGQEVISFEASEVRPGMIKYEFILGVSGMRLPPRKKCQMVITQDFTPMTYDGPITYKIWSTPVDNDSL